MKLLKHIQLLIAMVFASIFISTALAPAVYAAAPFACDGSSSCSGNNCKVSPGTQLDKSNCSIVAVIVFITNAIAALAGIVIVGMIVLGGIQYSAAGADPSKVQAAKKRIYNAVLALLLLVFGFGMLQWLVPGGMF